jgi:isoquinoline 1-oxidoreductase beta subunit
MSQGVKLTRRQFLVYSGATAGSFVLGFHLPTRAEPMAAGGESTDPEAVEVNAWIVVESNDTVIIRVARSEMGQGIFTALPMLVAEELECDWAKLRAEYAMASENLRRGEVFRSMSTGGSRSIRESQDYLRQSGAAAREMLVTAAANRWKVVPGDCRADNGIITHRPSGRSLRFGEVAGEAAKLEPPELVFLKDPEDWRLIGQPVKRLDTPAKVAGEPVFGTDVQFPGLLHAVIQACPVYGGRVKSFDEAAVKELPGVKTALSLDNAVAVVADSWWRAHQALQALPIDWDEGENASVGDAEIRARLEDGLGAKLAPAGAQRGHPDAVIAAAATLVEATYEAPYLAHATMEPMNCTARVVGGKVEVWVPTQNAMASLQAAARAAGVDPSKVVVHNTMLGGGFGRRNANQEYVEQAVRIAKTVKQPVKLIWSREEDMRQDFYRPASMARLRASLDSSGALTGMTARISAPSILASLRPGSTRGGMDPIGLQAFADQPYAIPNYRAEYAMRDTHVPIGFWRSVNHSQNAYFRECFLDEVAKASTMEPFELRRGLLKDSPKQLAVLEAAAEKADWGKPGAEGVHRGIAIDTSYGSHCAQVVEVKVNNDETFRILRVVCAIDPGHVVNPDTIEAQVESAIVYGLTAALYGEINIDKGRAVQGNFDDYPMLMLRHMPEVVTVTVPSGDFWGGLGEPPLPPLAPALCNALYAATGSPIRSLPLTKHGLRLA